MALEGKSEGAENENIRLEEQEPTIERDGRAKVQFESKLVENNLAKDAHERVRNEAEGEIAKHQGKAGTIEWNPSSGLLQRPKSAANFASTLKRFHEKGLGSTRSPVVPFELLHPHETPIYSMDPTGEPSSRMGRAGKTSLVHVYSQTTKRKTGKASRRKRDYSLSIGYRDAQASETRADFVQKMHQLIDQARSCSIAGEERSLDATKRSVARKDDLESRRKRILELIENVKAVDGDTVPGALVQEVLKAVSSSRASRVGSQVVPEQRLAGELPAKADS